MAAEPADVVHKLGADVLFKFLGEVVHRAGKHEVLPHQKTQLVAGIVEPVVGVVAAAPDADAVHVGGPGVLQQAAGALRGDSGQQVVLGNVVRAHGEDVHAVALMAEALAVLVLFPVDGEHPQADALFPGVQGLSGFQRHMDGVQGLIAKTGGPPQSGIVNGNDGILSAGGEDLSVGGGDGDLHGGVAGGHVGHVGVHGEGALAALMVLIHPNIPDAGGLYAQDGDAAPDAGVGETGAPVPAEHAVGLADGGEAHHGIGGAVGRVFLIGLADVFGWGVKGDGDLVFPCPESVLHIVLPGSVHIVGSAHRDAVDGDGGQGVQTLAAQQHLVAA